jgi:hypothetical protein
VATAGSASADLSPSSVWRQTLLPQTQHRQTQGMPSYAATAHSGAGRRTAVQGLLLCFVALAFVPLTALLRHAPLVLLGLQTALACVAAPILSARQWLPGKTPPSAAPRPWRKPGTAMACDHMKLAGSLGQATHVLRLGLLSRHHTLLFWRPQVATSRASDRSSPPAYLPTGASATGLLGEAALWSQSLLAPPVAQLAELAAALALLLPALLPLAAAAWGLLAWAARTALAALGAGAAPSTQVRSVTGAPCLCGGKKRRGVERTGRPGLRAVRPLRRASPSASARPALPVAGVAGCRVREPRGAAVRGCAGPAALRLACCAAGAATAPSGPPHTAAAGGGRQALDA